MQGHRTRALARTSETLLESLDLGDQMEMERVAVGGPWERSTDLIPIPNARGRKLGFSERARLVRAEAREHEVSVRDDGIRRVRD